MDAVDEASLFFVLNVVKMKLNVLDFKLLSCSICNKFSFG